MANPCPENPTATVNPGRPEIGPISGTWSNVSASRPHHLRTMVCSPTAGTIPTPAAQPPAAPELVTIPPLTVNLQNPQHEQRLLYIGFAITVGDKASQTFLQPYVPQLRSQLFKLLGEQDSTALMTSQGKSALAAKVLELVKRPLTTPQPELSILDVLYTDFIVQ